MKEYALERFITAQEGVYPRALAELQRGCKQTHWMWFIFPQLRILGQSDRAIFYGIAGEEEARAYCENELLYARYIECCQALEGLEENNPRRVMGEIDDMKLRSSLTLFYMVDERGRDLYKRLLEKFYHGKLDGLTVDFIQKERSKRGGV